MKAGRKRVVPRSVVLLLIITLILLSANLQIVPVKTVEGVWNASFGGTLADVAYCVLQTNDGGYVAAGVTESFGAGSADLWLVKTNASGTQQWNRTHGGTYADEARCVQQTNDGGYIVAGSTKSSGSGDADFWLVKTDANGLMQWSKTFGGVYEDRAMCAQRTTDGGYVIAGYTSSYGTGNSDFWLVKTDANGNAQWNRTYGGTGSDRSFSVGQTIDGGYILAGETDSFGSGNFDFWLLKTDPAGIQLWVRTYGGANLDVARSVKQTSDGGYIMAGWTDLSGVEGHDCLLVKTDSHGDLEWNRTYGYELDDEAYCIQMTSDGGYIIAGGSTNSSGLGGWDFWLVKTDAVGNTLWDLTNGESSDDLLYSVQQTSDGGYIVAGSTESYGAGREDFWLAKNARVPPRPPGEEGHDVAVIGVWPSKVIIGEGRSMSVNVSVENQGIHDETTRVSVYANSTLIDYSIELLASQDIATIIFTWNTPGFAKGRYTISAVADNVLEEVDTMDNTFVDGKVRVTILGDAQGDGKVDVIDLFDLGKSYGSYPSAPNWNIQCDFNDDGEVDDSDLLDLSENYGQMST